VHALREPATICSGMKQSWTGRLERCARSMKSAAARRLPVENPFRASKKVNAPILAGILMK